MASCPCVQKISSDTVVGEVTSSSWSADWQPTNGIVRASAPTRRYRDFIGFGWVGDGGGLSGALVSRPPPHGRRTAGTTCSSESETRADAPVARLEVVRTARGVRVDLRRQN